MGLVAIAAMNGAANEISNSGAYGDAGMGLLGVFYAAASAGVAGLGYMFAGAAGAAIGGALAAAPVVLAGGVLAAGAISRHIESNNRNKTDRFSYYTDCYEQRKRINKTFG